jgi:hypothetical protein
MKAYQVLRVLVEGDGRDVGGESAELVDGALSESTETDAVPSRRGLSRELLLSPKRVLVDSGDVVGDVNDGDRRVFQALLSFLLALLWSTTAGLFLVLLDGLLGEGGDERLDVLGQPVGRVRKSAHDDDGWLSSLDELLEVVRRLRRLALFVLLVEGRGVLDFEIVELDGLSDSARLVDEDAHDGILWSTLPMRDCKNGRGSSLFVDLGLVRRLVSSLEQTEEREVKDQQVEGDNTSTRAERETS